MAMETLQNKDDLEKMLARSEEETVVLYKHSATCPVSARAQEQVVPLKHEMSVYSVVVQYARDVSEAAAEALGVTHHTPQVIVVRNREVQKHYSHEGITTEVVREAATG